MQLALSTMQTVLATDFKASEVEVAIISKDSPKFKKVRMFLHVPMSLMILDDPAQMSESEIDGHLQRLAEKD